MNDLLVIAVASSLPKLGLSPMLQRLTAYGLIYVAWSFTLFYWLGNAAGNRVLSIGDNRLGSSDIFGILGLLPACLR